MEECNKFSSWSLINWFMFVFSWHFVFCFYIFRLLVYCMPYRPSLFKLDSYLYTLIQAALGFYPFIQWTFELVTALNEWYFQLWLKFQLSWHPCEHMIMICDLSSQLPISEREEASRLWSCEVFAYHPSRSFLNDNNKTIRTYLLSFYSPHFTYTVTLSGLWYDKK